MNFLWVRFCEGIEGRQQEGANFLVAQVGADYETGEQDSNVAYIGTAPDAPAGIAGQDAALIRVYPTPLRRQ